ncbi:MAG: acyl carrier protein [Verrucomicrobia bacterium]|nr:acyl carrier protein [Verrucomicrobiota bacterium]MDA1086674.1 acyl carrier protein [Verrucomicrobiota bacterium]
MTRDEIISKLRDIMKESTEKPVDWSTVSGESTIESLGFDSLSILDLIYDIQQEFDAEFDAEQLVSIQTVGELAEFLSSQLA